MSALIPYQGLLLDIEGTTTPVQFVYDILFPYAKRAMASYLKKHWDEADFQLEKREIIEGIADINASAAGEGAPKVDADTQSEEAFRAAVVAHLKWQMSEDQKNPPLKALQGSIWRAGYEAGTLKAPVYKDVVELLKACKASDTPVYIYSSGSVAAQILLFKYSDQGDLSRYLSGYFDTHTGPKKQAESYAKICAEIDIAPEAVLFVSDNLDEAIAAERAGLKVAVAKRPGNAPLQAAHSFEVLERFGPIMPD